MTRKNTPQTSASAQPQKLAKGLRKGLPDIEFGPLPVEKINRTLGLDLEPGPVIFTAGHQIHVKKSREADYGRLLPHVANVISNPLYIGDDIKNRDSFEMVGRVQVLNEWVLVAVKLAADDQGRYRVASFYPVSQTKIQNRRQNGVLQIVKP